MRQLSASPDQEKTIASQPAAVHLDLDIALIDQLPSGYCGEIRYRLLILQYIPYGAQRERSCLGHGHRHGP